MAGTPVGVITVSGITVGIAARTRGAVWAKRARRAVVAGAAGVTVCAVIAACAPVKMGAAAIVGNQRISQASLDSQVANLQTAAKPYGSALQLTSADMPAAVLSWLIRFDITHRAASEQGISVSQAQVQQGTASINAQAASLAAQQGYASGQEVLVGAGLAPQMMPQVGRWVAEQTAIEQKANGGRLPSTTDEQNVAGAALDKAQCTAAKDLNIQINPQFGRFDYQSSAFAVVPADDTLSRPAVSPSPANTEGVTPADCG